MITLRKAREKAKELVAWDYSIPSMSSLGDWRRYGCLTEPVEYKNKGKKGGRVGLYDDTLPLQIATTAELKEKNKSYKLKDIGKIAEQIVPAIINETSKVGEQFFSAFFEVNEDVNVVKEASEKAKEASDPEELKKAEEELESALDTIKRKYLIQDYYSAWTKYEKRYEKEKVEQ